MFAEMCVFYSTWIIHLYASIKSNIINRVIKPKLSCDKISFDKVRIRSLLRRKITWTSWKKNQLNSFLFWRLSIKQYSSPVGHVGQRSKVLIYILFVNRILYREPINENWHLHVHLMEIHFSPKTENIAVNKYDAIPSHTNWKEKLVLPGWWLNTK